MRVNRDRRKVGLREVLEELKKGLDSDDPIRRRAEEMLKLVDKRYLSLDELMELHGALRKSKEGR